jgi:osmotically-inducible protein OsmY
MKTLLCCILFYFLLHSTGCTLSSAVTGANLVYDHRNVAESLQEQVLLIKAKAAFASDEEISEYTTINVALFNKMALLTGYSPNHHLKRRAGRILSTLVSKKEIYNQIIVKPHFKDDTQIEDSLITAKVLSKLITSSEASPSDFKVITLNSIVYIMGVATPKEAKAAIQLAQGTPGVRKVVKVMEYIHRSKSMLNQDSLHIPLQNSALQNYRAAR